MSTAIYGSVFCFAIRACGLRRCSNRLDGASDFYAAAHVAEYGTRRCLSGFRRPLQSPRNGKRSVSVSDLWWDIADWEADTLRRKGPSKFLDSGAGDFARSPARRETKATRCRRAGRRRSWWSQRKVRNLLSNERVCGGGRWVDENVLRLAMLLSAQIVLPRRPGRRGSFYFRGPESASQKRLARGILLPIPKALLVTRRPGAA